MSECNWKPNWAETRQHLLDWWNHKGLVLGMWGAPPATRPIVDLPQPASPETIEETYTNSAWRAQKLHFDLSRSALPSDILPLVDPNLGPGSLALYLGSEPTFAADTVWFSDVFKEVDEPETLPPLRFDPENRWWKLTMDQLHLCKQLAGEHYMVGCPDLIEGLDILATLREPQTLLMDMLESPEWVEEKLRELNQIWFEVYGRIHDLIKLQDGSSAFGPFYLWGQGKTAKVQCDMSAMFSPAMYARFVMPGLREQCEWLDHSMYHLDGTQSIPHLDHILGIEALDAVEWTPQAGIETGGHKRWHDLYRRIIAAGKSVQVVNVEPDEVIPLLDAIGNKGVYIMMQFRNEQEAEQIASSIASYR